MLNNKSILITGGTGSFGKRITEKILEKFNPKKVIIFSRDELKQSEMQNEKIYQKKNVRFFLGDVRDLQRLKTAFDGVDVVIHAAALKQVPAAEYNPGEYVKTNIHGAQNVIQAAIDCNVKKVIALSTDKAVNPINLYGASKLVSDKLFVAANNIVGKKNICFSIVRYGNVSGSRGSVLPLFLELKKAKKKLTITHKDATRFWITLDQGIQFVFDCLTIMKGGEIFIPKIPAIKITDLAKVIDPQNKYEIIGLRPSEKLHEVLISPDESIDVVEFRKYYTIKPSFEFHTRVDYFKSQNNEKGKKIKQGFKYSSDLRNNLLNLSQIKKLIKV
ncbi:UDP-N-acetylglucosamine 4,6-dehydratase (inverting) [Candidatus Pelagibacter sp. HIMB1483]|uniref:UDP-N-acetylglucosamine 4,6-dehydratase (inverting) n=1 Tax=Candidatus Pelagibacter sp. HIMB1483 TaxID=3415414 RepID=UPI003F861572